MILKIRYLAFLILLIIGFVGCKNEPLLVLKEPVLGMEFIKIKNEVF